MRVMGQYSSIQLLFILCETVEITVAALTKSKSAGVRNISAELVKADIETVLLFDKDLS